MKAKIPRFMITACQSGGGKTTITCAILQALLAAGITPAAFKCGPDYIDPMFHSEVLGVKSRNLDLFLLPEEICRYLLVRNAQAAQIAVLEGAMGYYDGLGANSSLASSYHLAAATDTPAILVVDCKGSSFSLNALIKGFVQFRADNGLKGVILNNLAAGSYPLYKQMIEAETGLEVLGYFPHLEVCSLASRHLGLVTAAEVNDLQQKIRILGQQAQQTIDLEALLGIAREAGEISYEDFLNGESVLKTRRLLQEDDSGVTVAVARDKAFCFYYQDNLELLAELGVKITYFSPLKDKKVPECDGLILGGGYPEVYAQELEQNREMKAGLRAAIARKVPCIAECGGFMYLLEDITDQAGNRYEMVGAIPGNAFMTKKLSRFGYITLTSRYPNLLAAKDQCIQAHEFHYSDSTANGQTFIARKPARGTEWTCIHADADLFAGYPHLHFWGNIQMAVNFVLRCRQYRQAKKKDKFALSD